MYKYIFGIILVFSLITCTQKTDVSGHGSSVNINKSYKDDNSGWTLRKETISKENCSLVYTYNDNLLSYGINSTINLHLNYPVNLFPVLKLDSAETGSPIQNGVLLDIIRNNHVLKPDGSVEMIIKIVFEAFLPGDVIINPFTVEMFSENSVSTPELTFEVQSIDFKFTGDPSLVSVKDNNETEKKELAELITIEDRPKSTLLITIIASSCIILFIALFFFLKRKKHLAATINSEEKDLRHLKQTKQDYFEQLEYDNLRDAYGSLRKIIQLSPELNSKPKIKKKYLSECNDIYFSGKIISGESSKQHLNNLFLKIKEENKE